jgi:hypothetical protein
MGLPVEAICSLKRFHQHPLDDPLRFTPRKECLKRSFLAC